MVLGVMSEDNQQNLIEASKLIKYQQLNRTNKQTLNVILEQAKLNNLSELV